MFLNFEKKELKAKAIIEFEKLDINKDGLKLFFAFYSSKWLKFVNKIFKGFLTKDDLKNASEADLSRFSKVDVNVDGKLTQEGNFILKIFYNSQ